jgi:hypothetical protein
VNQLIGGSPMRDMISLVLVTAVFCTTTLEARVGAIGALPKAQTESKGKPTLKERILEIPPGTMIEVRLHDKQKIRGRLGELTNEGFGLTTAQGEKITTQSIAFNDVKSIKKIEGGKAGHAVVYALAGLGALLVVIVILAVAYSGG